MLHNEAVTTAKIIMEDVSLNAAPKLPKTSRKMDGWGENKGTP